MNDRPNADDLAEMRALGAATMYEAQGGGAVTPAIKPIDPNMQLAGVALTVNVPAGDNLALHYAISQAKPGEVIVADYKGHLDIAAWGDIMTVAAMKKGVAGMVIDGAVRDAREIVKLGFPMFCRGLSIVGPSKSRKGTVGQPIKLAGDEVKSGDIIVGDQDGVAIIKAEHWRDIRDKARARQGKEKAIFEGLDQGKTTVELLGLAEALKKTGIA